MTLIDMDWLPQPPTDFRQQCKAVDTSEHSGNEFTRLARHALNLNQLTSLSKSMDRVNAADSTLTPLTPFRLGLVGNGTTSLLGPAIRASGARHGLLIEIVEGPYNQAIQAALDPGSILNTARPNAVLIAFDHRIVQLPDDKRDADQAANSVAAALDQVRMIRDGVTAASGAIAIFQTLAPPPTALLGNFDRQLPGSLHSLADRFNAEMITSLKGTGDLILDVAALAQTVGLDTWHDATQWHLAKLPFAQVAIPLYADHVARLIGAMKGKSRKCLVLDLDNTIWGGVIGDDGIDGIALGEGDPTGEAFLDVQRTALQLRSMGIMLAVCSKNEDSTARLPFRKHPDMLIAESDIAVFQANWTDKATNLEKIAEALEIGVDTLVLMDDNPAERAQVRAALPDVAVPELPDDPAMYARTLLAAGYFEAVSLSAEDLLRADDYTSRAKRIELQDAARDLGSYLTSLEMEIVFAPFDATGRPRIAQLINKSNQFNLTTCRYTQNDVATMETDPSVFTLQVRLRDRFGDNGMISVVICRRHGAEWEIDSWLMSCRVLGRGVEQAVLAEIARCAGAEGVDTLRGRFIPSGRNELVRDHYAKLGFTDEGEGDWKLKIPAFEPADNPMKITRVDTASAA